MVELQDSQFTQVKYACDLKYAIGGQIKFLEEKVKVETADLLDVVLWQFQHPKILEVYQSFYVADLASSDAQLFEVAEQFNKFHSFCGVPSESELYLV